ncbi:MAG: hypothetical protein UY18_C0012G0015 [Microgenomates group bacterium GW2011_GWF2_47_9]|nr:MAG: hypothetical protein UY18_C0012G0015 [Microgenomates group bacterium GW2011_GWF2_47_9]
MSRGLTFAYLALTLALFFYSYGFVDLNLTLSAEPHLFSLVSSLQGLVYFNRPLSTQIYLFFVFAFFSLYLLVLNKSRSLKLTKFPLRLVVVLAVIFSLFYPFLSSDLFKYLFSAKMVVLYHANPHVVTPDFFASDPWIRFMRWVHTYAHDDPLLSARAWQVRASHVPLQTRRRFLVPLVDLACRQVVLPAFSLKTNASYLTIILCP